ncbi:MAG: hypothetical protein LBL45_11840 [Treponema sp.]|jgi:hypothetical protein|nr:hypothetical protein [Treponema sp.]
MNVLLAACIGIVIVTANAQKLAFFHIRWRQKDDELTPLLRYYEKRIVISIVGMFIILNVYAFFHVIFKVDWRLSIAIMLLLAWLASNVALVFAMRYISLRKEIAERKMLRGEETRK